MEISPPFIQRFFDFSAQVTNVRSANACRVRKKENWGDISNMCNVNILSAQAEIFKWQFRVCKMLLVETFIWNWILKIASAVPASTLLIIGERNKQIIVLKLLKLKLPLRHLCYKTPMIMMMLMMTLMKMRRWSWWRKWR